MRTVHILTEGFITPNGQAFLFPILMARRLLVDAGLKFRFFKSITEVLVDCDVLCIDNKYFRDRWARNSQKILETLGKFRELVHKLLWFDTTDSTGTLQVEVLPYVNCYYKAQLLKDRALYMREFYGNRIYTDYYHRNFGVEDADPQSSKVIPSRPLIDKLRVSWNSGLANYSVYGPMLATLYRYSGLGFLLREPNGWDAPESHRSIDVSCRFGISYKKATVRYQREKIRERLGDRLPTHKLGRRAYFQELKHSKIVISPFGFGEITLKDFETMISGAPLFKPDMGHLETWPDLFRDGETYVSFRWDLDDFDERLETLLGEPERRLRIASCAQKAYREFLSEEGQEKFCVRLKKILSVD